MSELTAEEKSALTVVTGDEKTPARISYAKIFKPEKNDLSGKEEYSCMVLIPKADTKTVTALKQAIKTAIKGRFGDKQPKGLRIPCVTATKVEMVVYHQEPKPGKHHTATITLSTARTLAVPPSLTKSGEMFLIRNKLYPGITLEYP